jgi:hypothetical protein
MKPNFTALLLTLLAVAAIGTNAATAIQSQPTQTCGTSTGHVDPPGNSSGGYTNGSGDCTHATPADAQTAALSEMLNELFGPCAQCPVVWVPCESFAVIRGGTITFGSEHCGNGNYKATWSVPPGVTIARACAGC